MMERVPQLPAASSKMKVRPDKKQRGSEEFIRVSLACLVSRVRR